MSVQPIPLSTRLSFLHLGGHYRQESVLALLKHLGDSVTVRHTALTLLSTLAHEHTSDMSKFTIFLKVSYFESCVYEQEVNQ